MVERGQEDTRVVDDKQIRTIVQPVRSEAVATTVPHQGKVTSMTKGAFLSRRGASGDYYLQF